MAQLSTKFLFSKNITPKELEELEIRTHRIKTWQEYEALNLWQNTEMAYKRIEYPLPRLMQLLHEENGDFEFKLHLAEDKEFWRKAGIPYHIASSFWNYVRGGAADIYFNQVIGYFM